MDKNILILKGSPRERGNSSVLADQLAAGAKSNGAKVESVYLHGLDIRACDACDLCEEGNGCVINDDMQALYPRFEAADAIVLASPVYWFTFSAQMKLCIDRCYAYQSNDWKEMQGKQYALILTYGDTDLYTSGGINAISTFETMCRFLNAEIAGMVYGTMSDVGDAEKQPEFMEQAYKLGQKLANNNKEKK
ncbi:MAG: flavodoxin family protein [Chloroflexi bacterium]|nr:flavodoxin family protein [Chloroflexota bacterium]